MEPEENKNIPNIQTSDHAAPTATNQNREDNIPLRTYKSDVASYIKTEGKTLADIAIAENARHSKYLEEEKSEPILAKKTVTIALIILILITLSAGIIWVSSLGKSGTQSGNSSSAMFVSGIDSKNLGLDNLDQNNTFNSIDAELKQGSPFLVLNLTEKNSTGVDTAIDSQTFFNTLGIYPPQDLLRSLSGQFSVGSIGGQARFLVLKINYYAGAFSGMLEWENSIENDLQNILDLPLPNNSGIMTEGSGTSTTLISVNQSGFTDSVIANRDTRILKDGSGGTILLYFFPDNNTIVITGSQNAAQIVSEKLLK